MSLFLDLAPYAAWAALAVNGGLIAMNIRRARRERRERSLRILQRHARDMELTSTEGYLRPHGPAPPRLEGSAPDA